MSIRPLILAAMLSMATGLHAAPLDDEVNALRQRAVVLFNSGNFDQALEVSKNIFKQYPNHPLGKTVYFHAGNALENKRVAETQTIAETEEALKQARDYYRMAAREVPNSTLR